VKHDDAASKREPKISLLRATLIDVGWGDCILLESVDRSSKSHYALIDSNDTATVRSSYIFLKRFFERRKIPTASDQRIFDWVLLTHAHADHGEGLKRILRHFGADRFWHPEPAAPPAFYVDLVRYASRPQTTKVGQCDVIHSKRILPSFGDASMEVLWPPPGLRPQNENNNSVVLAVTLNKKSFVLTGDAEAEGVWSQISKQIPKTTCFFKVPHHGSDNGTFNSSGHTPWLIKVPRTAKLGISSHVHPHSHPDRTVVQALAPRGLIYRTDEHYHVTVETDGRKVSVTYSHI
jgi:beta-lactamase superfamily II metal-dependent hydrolase